MNIFFSVSLMQLCNYPLTYLSLISIIMLYHVFRSVADEASKGYTGGRKN